MLAVLKQIDHQLFFALNNGLSSPWLDTLMQWVSVLGDGMPLTLLAGLGLWWYDRSICKRHYPWLILEVVLAALVSHGLKRSLERPRPLTEFATLLQTGTAHIGVVGPPLRHYSFPSGHTQAAAALFAYLTRLYPRRWLLWSTGVGLIGLSRIYAGVHFPGDVLAGACLGSLLAESVWRLASYMQARPSQTAARTADEADGNGQSASIPPGG
jgi:undecaprenyl-diphosphatase